MSTLPSVTFIKGQGGLGRPLTGQDFISAMLIYTADANLPAGFTTAARVKALYSIADAEAAGILNDYSDATAAAATYLVTGVGTNGDTLKLTVADIDVNGIAHITNLGTYTKVAGDTTAALMATAMAAIINAGTITHGYSASAGTGTITITAPKRLGIYLNTGTPLVATIVGTIAGTLTQFSAATVGVASRFAVWHYHISEFFRIQPKGILYLGFYAVPGTYAFSEIDPMQTFANGTIHQIGVLKDPAGVYATADLTALSTACAAQDAIKRNLSAIYAADLSGTADISTLTDLSLLTANKVSDCIGQDGAGHGNYLWLTTKKSITTLGAELGAVSLSKVSESIAWLAKFNMSNGTELEVAAFANGVLHSDPTITPTLIESLNAKRHVFVKKFSGYNGTYFNDAHTAIAATSDYAYIQDNRTIDKAIRNVYTAMLPSLNSPITLNADGTLADTSIAYFESQAGVNLDSMVRDGELSAYGIVINSTQNVLSTGKIIIAVQLIQNGVARFIEIPIGYTTSIR